jgi:hypothetical protein
MKKVLTVLNVLLIAATLAVPALAKPASPFYPAFTEGATVKLVDSGNRVVVENAEGNFVASERISTNDSIVNLANGNLVVLYEIRGGKYVGLIGWTFIGNDGQVTSGSFTY